MKRILIFLLITFVIHFVNSARVLTPITLRTKMNVRPADPQKTQFLQVKVSKDGRPVGIIVKRRGQNQNSKNKNKQEKIPPRRTDEVPEIIGVRVPDSIDDAKNLYRNGAIVNNTLLMQTQLLPREK